MCVIMIADGTRPTVEMVDKAYEKNPVGAGIAWREKDSVRWKKGLELGELQDLVKRLPMPFIMHCRIDTCGGESKELTHPFAISKESPLILNGRTKGYAMFHNGHWHPWKDKLLDIAIKSNVKLPDGRWSDSRAMAFTASIYGLTALELIDEKAAVLSPTDLQAFGSGWAKVNDVWCSNKLWETTYVTHHHKEKKEEVVFKKPEQIVVKPTGGASPQETFRTGHEGLQLEKDIKEGVEAGAQGLRSGNTEGAEDSQDSFDDGPPGDIAAHALTLPLDKNASLDLNSPEGAEAAVEWVRSLNPSSFRAPLHNEAHLPKAERRGSSDLALRRENARLGITHLGKL